ncbi:MAG TPA: TatD family hydrolase, partial [Gemmatimonadaceae bacterium]|nr:TatD family hydrolase [Gemmatimonadaceae bacterium]
NIATREREWDEVLATAEREPDVWATVGIHPHEADEHPHIDTAKLVARAAHPRIVGIGETGLDYYYDHSDRARQQASFRAHIAAAREAQVPIIVHTRDAEDDTREMIREARTAGASGVLHCYTGSRDLAEFAIDAGWYISFAGIITFKKWTDEDLLRLVPDDRLLVESDSPYLAPVPFRGKRNEPAWVAHTVEKLATVRGSDALELGKLTAANTERLFGLAFEAAE